MANNRSLPTATSRHAERRELNRQVWGTIVGAMLIGAGLALALFVMLTLHGSVQR